MINNCLKTLMLVSLMFTISVNAAQDVSKLNPQQFEKLQTLFTQFISSHAKPSKEDWDIVGINMTETEDSYTFEADNKILFSVGKVIVKKTFKPLLPVLILQAPHQFYDIHTGKIAKALFIDDKFQVLMLNTSQRYSSQYADLAHQKLTIFSAFSEIFTEINDQTKVVQLHGFSTKKRKTNAGKYADMIISNGTKYPDHYLRELQTCHRVELGNVTRIYGYDVFELGAITNTIGKRLNNNKIAQFIHIELSKETREYYQDTDWLRGFSKCL